MVVATKNKQQILVEFFFDFSKNNYFVNKFTYLAEKVFDVVLNKNYGFVIGYNTHKIVMHGIFNKFKEDFGELNFNHAKMFKAVSIHGS